MISKIFLFYSNDFLNCFFGLPYRSVHTDISLKSTAIASGYFLLPRVSALSHREARQARQSSLRKLSNDELHAI